MKRIVSITPALLALGLTCGQSAIADNHSKANPVEFFTCNYVEGKGLSDLKKVGAAFAKWSKKNDHAYAAWIMTPQFHDPEVSFDVGWLGAWPDGNAFGKGQDTWMAKGGDIAEEFAEVFDCSSSHQMAASVPINAPEGTPGNGVVMFSQCTVEDGVTVEDSMAAHKKLAGEMKSEGGALSSWIFYPSLGAGDIDFHYWSVLAAENYTQLGAAIEMYNNGGGWQKRRKVMGDVVSCGSPSVFEAHLVVGPES